MPANGTTDRLIAATEELTDAIAKPRHASPFLFHGRDERTAFAKLVSLLTTTTSSLTSVSPPRVEADPSPSPRVATSQSPRVASPPDPSPPPPTTTRKLVSHLEAGPYRNKPVGPRRARSSHTAGYANAIHVISEREPYKWTYYGSPILQERAPHYKRSPESDYDQTSPHRLPNYEHFAYAVTDDITGERLEYRQLILNPKYKEVWTKSSANEFGRLAQGVGKGATEGTKRVEGTSTMFFIHCHQVPKGKKVSYARTVCMIRPEKDEKERTRITCGGDQLDYDGKVATETSSLETAKLHINSTISTPGAKYMCMDAGNFYLNTPLDDFQYMRFPVWMPPDRV